MRSKLPLMCLSTLMACSIAGTVMADTTTSVTAPTDVSISKYMSSGIMLTFLDLSNANDHWRVRFYKTSSTVTMADLQALEFNIYGEFSYYLTSMLTNITGSGASYPSLPFVVVNAPTNSCQGFVNLAVKPYPNGQGFVSGSYYFLTVQACATTNPDLRFESCSTPVISNILKY